MGIKWDLILTAVMEFLGSFSEAMAKRAELKAKELPIRLAEHEEEKTLRDIANRTKSAKELRRLVRQYTKLQRRLTRSGVDVSEPLMETLGVKIHNRVPLSDKNTVSEILDNMATRRRQRRQKRKA